MKNIPNIPKKEQPEFFDKSFVQKTIGCNDKEEITRKKQSVLVDHLYVENSSSLAHPK